MKKNKIVLITSFTILLETPSIEERVTSSDLTSDLTNSTFERMDDRYCFP